MTPSSIDISVNGRPAPQGSKRRGAAGQMREQSVYLPAWRAAVGVATYRRYQALGIRPEDLPLFSGAVEFGATFWMPGDHRVDGPPDLDKLVRAVWDALTTSRVWEDDCRVTEVLWLSKCIVPDGRDTGCDLRVKKVEGR